MKDKMQSLFASNSLKLGALLQRTSNKANN